MARSGRGGGSTSRDVRKDFLQGCVMGALVYMAMWALRLPKAFLEFDYRWGILAAMALGGVLYIVRLRSILWVLGTLCAILFTVVCMTPIFPRSARHLIRVDELRKADAVVVLGSYVTREKRLDHVAFVRMVDGLRLVRDGWAPVLVWTRVGGDAPDATADVRALVRLCGNPPTEAVGPVESTRDEAMLVAELAHKRKWKRIILVTSPYHSARAWAIFSKLGLEVISRPSVEREFAPSDPRSMRERMEVFRWWMYEQVRWLLYRVRGWV